MRRKWDLLLVDRGQLLERMAAIMQRIVALCIRVIRGRQ